MFVVTVNGDNLVELTETLEVSARIDSVQTGVLASFENNSATDVTARATIFDNDSAIISVAPVGSTMIAEPATAADSTSFNFRITSSNPIAFPINFIYTLTEGAAIAEQDYEIPTGDLASGNLTLAANTTTVNLPVNIIGDEAYEDTEDFIMTLKSIIMGELLDITLNDGAKTATAFIVNNSRDRRSSVTIRPYTQNVTEGGSVTFHVDINRSPDQMNLSYSFSYNVRATTSGHTISNNDIVGNITNTISRTILEGATRDTFTIQTIDDNVAEFNESFEVEISDSVDNATVVIAAPKAKILINDNDVGDITNLNRHNHINRDSLLRRLIYIKSSGLTFSWDYPATTTLASDRVVIAYQKGETAPANCETGTIKTLNSKANSYRLEGLAPGQLHSFRLCLRRTNFRTDGSKFFEYSPGVVTSYIDSDNDGMEDSIDVDDNNNGLLDIRTAEEFNNMRNNLTGYRANTTYKFNKYRSKLTVSHIGALGGYNGANNYYCTRDRFRLLGFVAISQPLRLCGYEIMNDIDLSGYPNWQPIGSSDDPFKAIFEGNGYTISNLTINRGSSSDVGLFAKLDKAIVQNVNFENVNIIADSTVGTVAGTATASYFENIKLKSGSVRANNGASIGGLVGVFQNYATGYYQNRYFGRRVAYKLSNAARNVHNRLDITARYTGSGIRKGVGGLVGASQASYIIQSSSNATINVSANISDVGGLVGSLTVNPALDNDRINSPNSDDNITVPINGTVIIPILQNGAPVNRAERSIVRQSFSAGRIIIPANEALVVGGLAGRNNKYGIITNSFSTVNITGTIGSRTNSAVPTKAIGGLIGYNNGHVGSTYATGSITNTNVANVGGLIGFSNNIDIYSRNFKVDSKTGNHGSNFHSHNWITTITLDHLEGLRGDNGDDGKDWKTNGYANWLNHLYVFNNDPDNQRIFYSFNRDSVACYDGNWQYRNNETVWVMRGYKSFSNWSRNITHVHGDNTTSQVDAPTTDENGNSAAYYQMPAIRCMGSTNAERKANIDYQRRLFRR